MTDVKDRVQQHCSALGRRHTHRQPVQRQRSLLRERRIGLCRRRSHTHVIAQALLGRLGHFGQPLRHPLATPQTVNGQVAHHRQQPSLGSIEHLGIGLQRSHIGILHGILGLCRAQQAGCSAEQSAATGAGDRQSDLVVLLHSGMVP